MINNNDNNNNHSHNTELLSYVSLVNPRTIASHGATVVRGITTMVMGGKKKNAFDAKSFLNLKLNCLLLFIYFFRPKSYYCCCSRSISGPDSRNAMEGCGGILYRLASRENRRRGSDKSYIFNNIACTRITRRITAAKSLTDKQIVCTQTYHNIILYLSINRWYIGTTTTWSQTTHDPPPPSNRMLLYVYTYNIITYDYNNAHIIIIIFGTVAVSPVADIRISPSKTLPRGRRYLLQCYFTKLRVMCYYTPNS